MRKRSVCVVAVLILMLGIAPSALAQRTTATVRGTVADETGGQMPGVKVSIDNPETGFSREAFTNESGNYNFSGLPVGTYNLSAELDGFKTAVQTGLRLNVADTREVNLTLELGAITEEITTTAASVPVETISGEVASLVTGEQIRELPLNGRNFSQLPS